MHGAAEPPTPSLVAAGSREGSVRAGLRSRRSSDPQSTEGGARAAASPPRRVQGTSERLKLQLQGRQPELEPQPASVAGRWVLGSCTLPCMPAMGYEQMCRSMQTGARCLHTLVADYGSMLMQLGACGAGS